MGGVKKYQLKRALAKIFKVKTWQLIIVALLLVFLDATLLRFDHIRMLELRQAVLAADDEGDSEAIINSLNDLRDFSLHHIVINEIEENGSRKVVFGTGAFYLEKEYIRQATAALQKAQQESDYENVGEGNIFKEAGDVCDELGRQYGWFYYDYSGSNYLNCFVDELNKHQGSDTRPITSQAKLPSTELYRYDYASPIWYPCFSGIMILITIILLVAIAIRILIWIGLRIALAVVK